MLLLVSSESRAQLTRLDSVLAHTVAGHLVSVDPGVRVAADSGFDALTSIMHLAATGSTAFRFEQVMGTMHDLDSRPRMRVSLTGGILPQGSLTSTPHTWTADVDVELTPRDRAILETNSSRYVHLDNVAPESFWESTLEPTLVIIGAAAIVALFFLIRS